MPWRRVGPAHTQSEREQKKKKNNQGKDERKAEESTYNRKQRNFTCSVVLMHPRIDRKETDRWREEKRVKRPGY